MKKIIVILAVLLAYAVSANAQDLVKIDSTKVTTGTRGASDRYAYEFEQIYYLDLSRAELWSNLRSWVTKHFTKAAIEMEDKEQGRVTITYTVPVSVVHTGFKGNVTSSMQVDVRDGRFRVKLFNQEMKMITDTPDLRYMATPMIEQYKKAAQEVLDASKKYFGGTLTWRTSMLTDDSGIPTCVIMAFYHINKTNTGYMDTLIPAMRYKDDF